jgi:hypothetical protein
MRRIREWQSNVQELETTMFTAGSMVKSASTLVEGQRVGLGRRVDVVKQQRRIVKMPNPLAFGC